MVARGACMVGRGHVWLAGGVHGCWGTCVVAGGCVGGMHDCQGHAWLPGGHAWLPGRYTWLPGGACMVAGGVHGCQGACVVAGGCAWLQGGMHRA